MLYEGGLTVLYEVPWSWLGDGKDARLCQPLVTPSKDLWIANTTTERLELELFWSRLRPAQRPSRRAKRVAMGGPSQRA